MSRRGCLCPDRDIYHVDCCDDSNDKKLKPQGIGNLIGQNESNKVSNIEVRIKSVNR